MKKIIPIIALLLLMLASCQQSGKVSRQGDLSADSVDVVADSDTMSVIESICESFNDTLTPEEAARWDSMNANGGGLLIRGAERNLDTIVNHTHIIFITDP